MPPLSTELRPIVTLCGEAVAPGFAHGKAFVYRDVLQRDSETYLIEFNQIDEEENRVTTAIDQVSKGLLIDAKQIEGRFGNGSADIFLAQESMLRDPMVKDHLREILHEELVNAEQVVRIVFRRLARTFRDMADETFRARGDDVDDLSRRLLLSLGGIHAHSLESLPSHTILVARRLLPSDTVFLSRASTVGVVAEFAGSAAHAALLAREMGIPCVGGISGLLERVRTGDDILVDGSEGTVIVNPNDEYLQQFIGMQDSRDWQKKERIRASRRHRAVTPSGIEVPVMANVRSREDVELAMRLGADGIGLFRTEPFFMAMKHFPSDQEFAAFLLHCLAPARGRPISIRLLDIGADKSPVYLNLPVEADPFLGRRGIRVLRQYPDLLEAQLRALLEVSRQIPISLLIPMVTTERDIVDVVEMLGDLAGDMGIPELPGIGATIETPAAALSIPTLKPHVDFFSIGSNDLTQYTMAAGRENPLVSQYFIDDHPSVFRLIDLVVSEAGAMPVSICGELAGRLEVVSRLIESGIDILSVPAAVVPDVKAAVCECRL